MVNKFCLILLVVQQSAGIPLTAMTDNYVAVHDVDPEVGMNVPQLISRWAYPVEVHNATTVDGYILQMHRIPYGRTGKQKDGPRPVVLFVHGLQGASSDWVTNLPNEAAGFIFADAGYDVWLGNVRGNTYGRQHLKWNPNKDKEFWEFSWDDMAKHDLPALIETALNISDQRSLYYVGHSQGTAVAFGGFSENLELAKKVKKLFALGPVISLKHFNGLLKFLALFSPQLHLLFNIVGINEFLPHSDLITLAGKYVCGNIVTNQLICRNIYFLLAGPNSHQTNTTRIPVYVSFVPAGSSTQNIVHFAQMGVSGLFNHYDYGSRKKNQEKYGQPTPPLYPVESMQVPTYLFYGDKDTLTDPQDVEANLHRFSKIRGAFKQRNFNHIDFIWGLRAPTDVYSNILRLIRED